MILFLIVPTELLYFFRLKWIYLQVKISTKKRKSIFNINIPASIRHIFENNLLNLPKFYCDLMFLSHLELSVSSYLKHTHKLQDFCTIFTLNQKQISYLFAFIIFAQ